MANVSDTDMSSLQASSSSTPGQVPAMTGTQVGKGKGNGGDSDSSEHVVRTSVAKRAPSPYPSRSSILILVADVTEPHLQSRKHLP